MFTEESDIRRSLDVCGRTRRGDVSRHNKRTLSGILCYAARSIKSYSCKCEMKKKIEKMENRKIQFKILTGISTTASVLKLF
jgi:hypothetical protein